MIELNDIWQVFLFVIAGRVGWDGYALAKEIVIDIYIQYRQQD